MTIAKLILSNAKEINEPTRDDVISAVALLKGEASYSLTMYRTDAELLSIGFKESVGFSARFRVDFPLTEFSCSGFVLTDDRIATILYYYSRWWSPRDFEEFRWDKKQVIDIALYRLRLLSRVALSGAALSTVLGFILYPDHFLDCLLAFGFTGSLVWCEPLYLKFHREQEIDWWAYGRSLSAPAALIIAVVAKLLK